MGDADGRIDGTTYPRAVAPEGSVEIVVPEGWSARLLHPQPGDVLVIRTDRPLPLDMEQIQALVRAGGMSAVVVLPVDCLVHLEPPRLHREDRGYRETAVYGTDKDDNQDARGVHTGVPGLPDGPLTPHPESESGEDDPCAG